MIYFFSCSRSMENKSFLSSASSSYFCFWRSSSIFLTSSSLSFSFAFSLYFSDSISIADFLLDLATFFLVPVEINYKRKKRKSVVFIYIEEQPKASSPPLPPGVGKEMEICNHSVAENWATTLKLWIYWVPKMSSQALEADSQICLNKNIYIIYMDFIKQTFCSLHHTLLSFHGPQ